MYADACYTFKGVIVRGLGRGARYVEIYSKSIEEELGLIAYPGTLNIRLHDTYVDKVWALLGNVFTPRIIRPPREGFGKVLAWEAYIKKGSRCIRVFIIRPEKTVHGVEILEAISDRRLLDELGAEFGDEVEIVFMRGEAPTCTCL